MQYHLLTGEKKKTNELVRSVQSLSLDLRRWNINYGANKLRPFFIGHERQDVVEHRTKLVDYFLSRQDLYYRITQGEDPQWIIPTSSNPVLLLCRLTSLGCVRITSSCCDLFLKVTTRAPSGPMKSRQNAGQSHSLLRSLPKDVERA